MPSTIEREGKTMMDIYTVVMRIEREMKKQYPDWQVVEAMQKLLKEYSEKVTKKLYEVA